MRKSNSGFTLIELVVAIAASAIVMAAAASFMLMGLRLEKSSSDTASAQSDYRIIMKVLENIAAEGAIADVAYSTAEPESGEDRILWKLYKAPEDADAGALPDGFGEARDESLVILSYNQSQKTINGKDGVVVIEGVDMADISYENNVLKCDITSTEGESYSSSVYCRISLEEVPLASIEVEEEKENVIEQVDGMLDRLQGLTPAEELEYRRSFLGVIMSQYGSDGRIYDTASDYNGLYYSQWYKLDWGKDTPWCAIFMSWCLDRILAYNEYPNKNVQRLSSLVDSAMWYQFGRDPEADMVRDEENHATVTDEKAPGYKTDYDKNLNEVYRRLGTWRYPETKDQDNVVRYTPKPGDLVFFENTAGNGRADHLGCVLYVEGDTVFTIEGNHDDRVGIYSYSLEKTSETEYIVGYGVLDWAWLLKGQESGDTTT